MPRESKSGEVKNCRSNRSRQNWISKSAVIGVGLATVAAVAAPALGDLNYSATILYPLNMPAGSQYYVADLQPHTAAGGQTIGKASINPGPVNDDRAILWSAATSSPVNLQPVGAISSIVLATDGFQQVGYEGTRGGNEGLLWSGTPASAIALTPDGYGQSEAIGLADNQQVGDAILTKTGRRHAMIWFGSAASFVDLNPIGFTSTSATATDGLHQVGSGAGAATGGATHPLLWSGSADSVVDLYPTDLPDITTAVANDVGGNEQVGYGSGTAPGDNSHALLWFGTAASAVDLNPTDLADITKSVANGTNGALQVGYGIGPGTGGHNHALLWSGSADSAVDLHLLLPAGGLWYDSFAYTVDSAGNIYGTADNSVDGNVTYYAIEWSPVPEPAVFSLLIVASMALLRRRRLAVE